MDLRSGSNEPVACFDWASQRFGSGDEFTARISYKGIHRQQPALKSQGQLMLQPALELLAAPSGSEALHSVSQLVRVITLRNTLFSSTLLSHFIRPAFGRGLVDSETTFVSSRKLITLNLSEWREGGHIQNRPPPGRKATVCVLIYAVAASVVICTVSTVGPIRYSLMALAAVRPAPMARITVAPPVTMSPPANTPGLEVASCSLASM
jgi:hypothetical protein